MRLASISLVFAAALSTAGCLGLSVVGGPDDVPGAADALDASAQDITVPTFDVPDVSTMDAPVDVADDAAADVPVDAPVDVPVDVPRGCTGDPDCASDPGGRVCNRLSGRCVQCLADDACPATQHCDLVANTCVAGCRSDDGCVTATGDGGVAHRYCDTTFHECVRCTMDAHCPSGSVCRGNMCAFGCAVTSCPNTETCCEGGCVDARANTAHCGGCGRVCAVANGTPECRAGACAVARCSDGYGDCNGSAADGCELDTRSDPANCGGCARACPSAPNATPTCAMSRCGYECVTGFGDCDGDASNGCETDLSSTLGHCGACGNACPAPANGAAACRMGACVVASCSAGFGNCDGADDTGCETDLSVTTNHCGMCGNACFPGLLCAAGRCYIPCPDGQTSCSGRCTVLDNDPNNCGACGNRCTGGALCGGGRCVSTCTSGQVTCAGACTFTATDPANCGACGNACPAGNTCVGGACRVACVAGQTLCSGSCFDLSTSGTHCGACGNTCGPGEQCMAGRCTLTCRAPQVVCGAECAELSRDPNNCGACGRVCPTGCFESACARVDNIEAGTFNNCVRYTSGRVFCWGRHATSSTFANGMLTSAGGAYGHRATPVQLLDPAGVPVEGIQEVAMGASRACARLVDGSVRCWASGTSMGVASGLPSVTQIAGRETNFCGLGSDGQVYCWDGLPRLITAPALTPAVTLAARAVEVRAGGTFTCARFADRTVQCWGTGTSGQLGNGASVNSATVAVRVTGLTDAEELTAGRDFACARRTSGAVVCWGRNAEGQLGDGTTTARNVPVAVPGLTARTLRAGLRHVCAIVTDGTVRCWGDNALTQIGDGTTTNRPTPTAVPGIPVGAFRIAAYDHHSCVVGTDRRVFCWGNNPFGEAGGGTEAVSRPQPIQYMGADLTGITQLEVGQAINGALMATAQWKCALHTDGRVFCWGNRVNGNEAGQLGRGNTTAGPTPVPVTGVADATQIAVGWQHACALRRGGTVVCWGSNVYGQLGDATNTNRSLPVAVTGLTGVVEVRAADFSTCARLSTGQLRCWGRNFYGNLGNGTMIDSNVPVPVMGVSTAVQLTIGSDTHCVRLANTEVHCWGRNLETELGDGFRTNRSIPFPVQTASASATTLISQTGFTNVHTDHFRSYGQTVLANTLGWGWTFTARSAVVPALADVVYNTRVQVFGEPIDTECEIRLDGQTYCRGRNEFGQIGDGTTGFTAASYVSISRAFSAVRLGRGYGTPCAVERGGGRAMCWGWTGNGALLAAGVTGNTPRAAEVVMP